MTFSADLSGHRALVTGASSGLGAHFAKLLAAHGAAVILAARRFTLTVAVADEIRGSGGDAEVVAMNVAIQESIKLAFSEAGSVEFLVNNAGIVVSRHVFDQTEEDRDDVLDTNLKGGWIVAKEGARCMKVAGLRGSIINIASILGLRQGNHVTPYAV